MGKCRFSSANLEDVTLTCCLVGGVTRPRGERQAPQTLRFPRWRAFCFCQSANYFVVVANLFAIICVGLGQDGQEGHGGHYG